jgi:hypothetical protein
MSCDKQEKALEDAERNHYSAYKKWQSAAHSYIKATEQYGALQVAFAAALAALPGGSWLKLATKAASVGTTYTVGAALSEQNVEDARNSFLSARNDLAQAGRELSKAMSELAKCHKQKAENGCGSRGGPGWRTPGGKCASWSHEGAPTAVA